MKKILATLKKRNGEVIHKYFLIDNVDNEFVKKYKWSIHSSGYIRATINGKRQYLHDALLGCKNIDHINNNKADNRRSNLRLATPGQNIANTKKQQNTSSQYKGVRFDKSGKRKKRWMAAYEHNNKSHTIGRYHTEIQAAQAYNVKALEIWGDYAKLNRVNE